MGKEMKKETDGGDVEMWKEKEMRREKEMEEIEMEKKIEKKDEERDGEGEEGEWGRGRERGGGLSKAPTNIDYTFFSNT